MCGRFTYKYSWKEIVERLRAFLGSIEVEPGVAEQPARYNIAPTQPIAVLREIAGVRKTGLMRWGLVPGWVKDPREFPLIINARAETLGAKPAFRGGLRHHRCIVPASGYYEWKRTADGKQPFHVTRTDGEPLFFAALYTDWMGPDGEEIDTAAIITVAAEGVMKQLHDRTPAILEAKDVDAWLDVRNVGEKQAAQMLKPLPEGLLQFEPVSRRVNSVANDDHDLIRPVSTDKPEAPARKKPAAGQLDLF